MQIKNIIYPLKKLFLLILNVILLVSCVPVTKKTVESKSPNIRVLLNEISNKDSLVFNGNYSLHSEEAIYEFGAQNNKIYIQPGIQSFVIYNNLRYLEYQKTKSVCLKAENESSCFKYKAVTYYGDMIFTLTNDSIIQIINELPLEEYLRGVVPAEIFASKPDNFEAVKAQSVCSRTYAINRMNEMKDKNFDVYFDTRDQVYKGMDVYNNNSDNAINDTRGLILTFKNEPATIYYHSTCGGELEPVQNVFSDKEIEYLAGGIDAVTDVISCSVSPRFRWEETRTIDQIDSSFQKLYDKTFMPDNDKVEDTVSINLDVNILNRSVTGRVKDLKISTHDTAVIVKNFQIRRMLGEPNGRALPSTLFYLSQENDSTLTIHGGGYGHGVGMCQYGAMNMSKRGFKYYHILNKYYPGTLLLKGY